MPRTARGFWFRSATAACVMVGMQLVEARQTSNRGPQPLAGPQTPSPIPRTLKNAPPFPNASGQQQILQNLLWGLAQTRMDRGLEAALQAQKVFAYRILDVESETTRTDYYIVELNTVAGIPFRDAILSKDGWLWSLGQLADGERRTGVPNLNDVMRALTIRFGSSTGGRYYHAGNNLERGGSFYVPLIKAETPLGRVFVTSKGDVYVEESFQQYRGSREIETRDLGRKMSGQRWLVKRAGIATVRRIESLEIGK